MLGYALEIPGLYKRRNLESRGHQVKKLWAEPKFNLMKECVASLLRFCKAQKEDGELNEAIPLLGSFQNMSVIS